MQESIFGKCKEKSWCSSLRNDDLTLTTAITVLKRYKSADNVTMNTWPFNPNAFLLKFRIPSKYMPTIELDNVALVKVVGCVKRSMIINGNDKKALVSALAQISFGVSWTVSLVFSATWPEINASIPEVSNPAKQYKGRSKLIKQLYDVENPLVERYDASANNNNIYILYNNIITSSITYQLMRIGIEEC